MTLERVAITGATHHQLDLTPRERAILCLIAGGLTTSQAAARLHISRHTAAQHIAAMLRRTQARSRGELIAHAYASRTLAAGTWPPRAEADQPA